MILSDLFTALMKALESFIVAFVTDFISSLFGGAEEE